MLWRGRGARLLAWRGLPGLVLRPPGQFILHAGRAEMTQHRGLAHPQAAGDLRVPHPSRPPFPRPRPRARLRRAGPAPRPDQPAGALPQRPLVQRRHVVHGQPRRRGHRLTGVAQLPQRRHRHVPCCGVIVPVPEQQHRPGEDQRFTVCAEAVQVPRIRHAFQDRSGSGRHAPILLGFNAFRKVFPVCQRRSGEDLPEI